MLVKDAVTTCTLYPKRQHLCVCTLHYVKCVYRNHDSGWSYMYVPARQTPSSDPAAVPSACQWQPPGLQSPVDTQKHTFVKQWNPS